MIHISPSLLEVKIVLITFGILHSTWWFTGKWAQYLCWYFL